jgi:hypothetical protein
MPGKRSRYVSSDSDSEVGRRMDSSYSDSDSDTRDRRSRPKKAPKKKPEKAPQEKKPKAPVTRIPTARRMEIIQKKQRGIDDPEYSCVQNANGSWRVSRRKFPLDQTPKIEQTSPPSSDVHVTWMNMQQSVNDSLKGELAQLREKYEKISSKYEEGKKDKKAPGKKKAPKKAAKAPGKKKAPPKREKASDSYSYYSESDNSDTPPPPPPPPQPRYSPPPQAPPRRQVGRYQRSRIDVRDF